MIAQADSRKWMARLYNSFLFMEAKIMKMAKKLLALVLDWCYGSVHADWLRSVRPRCYALREELLDKMNTFGAADNVNVRCREEGRRL